MPDITTLVIPVLLRWVHVLAGIIWIGHLYFFNFVNANFEKTLDAAAKKTVVPQLRPRALWWFRWGAMITMLSGVIYIIWEQFVASSVGFSTWFDSGNNLWITMGMLFGLVMWFNVWFVIWPNQKKALGLVEADADTKKKAARVAMLASRTNTLLSIAMLYCMVGQQNVG
jgi:uncharacterized membrane protein